MTPGVSSDQWEAAGRKREGGQSVPLSAPRCLAHNFPARRWKGAAGVGAQGALELLRKIGARPRGLGAHGLSTSALAPSCPNPVRASRADRALATQPKTLREAFRQTRPLECLRDGWAEGWTLGSEPVCTEKISPTG